MPWSWRKDWGIPQAQITHKEGYRSQKTLGLQIPPSQTEPLVNVPQDTLRTKTGLKDTQDFSLKWGNCPSLHQTSPTSAKAWLPINDRNGSRWLRKTREPPGQTGALSPAHAQQWLPRDQSSKAEQGQSKNLS